MDTWDSVTSEDEEIEVNPVNQTKLFGPAPINQIEMDKNINSEPKKRGRRPKKCTICNQKVTGNGIGCENEACPDYVQWNHFSCVGIDENKIPEN